MLKFSQMKTSDEDLDKVFDLIDVIDNVVSDKEFMKEVQSVVNVANGLKKSANTDELTNTQILQALALKRKTFIRLLLKDKRDEVLRIIAIMKDSDLDAIKKQPLPQTLIDAYTLINDKELVAFFTQQAQETAPTEEN